MPGSVLPLVIRFSPRVGSACAGSKTWIESGLYKKSPPTQKADGDFQNTTTIDGNGAPCLLSLKCNRPRRKRISLALW